MLYWKNPCTRQYCNVHMRDATPLLRLSVRMRFLTLFGSFIKSIGIFHGRVRRCEWSNDFIFQPIDDRLICPIKSLQWAIIFALSIGRVSLWLLGIFRDFVFLCITYTWVFSRYFGSVHRINARKFFTAKAKDAYFIVRLLSSCWRTRVDAWVRCMDFLWILIDLWSILYSVKYS